MFKLTSSGITNGIISYQYGIRSLHVDRGVPLLSIPLRWESAPEGTRTYAIVFQDYDNIPDEGFSWIHWLVADIPAEVTVLKEDESRTNPNLIQGRNSWMTPFEPYHLGTYWTDFYGGPAPLRRHEYEFGIYALDRILNLKNGFFYNELRNAMAGHIIAEAVLKGYYDGNESEKHQ